MKISRLLLMSFTAMMLLSLLSHGQTIQWNNAPQKGYVFRITNSQAQKLLSASRPDGITHKLLYDMVDTFNVKEGWIKRPDRGHFILVEIRENKIHCRYTCVFPYQVFLLSEYNALALQVLDNKGNVRDDAKVKLGRFNRIRIDTESKTYRVENTSFHGEKQVVTVELNGFRSVFNIQKHEVPEWYNTYSEADGPDFYSYLITDKNKYKPNERVRFKSYALSESRSPLRSDLEIWLNAYPKQINLGTVSPHRPGGFAGEFILHDSLKLILDRDYNIQLRDKSNRIVASCSFKYEDYILTGNRLDVQLAENNHYYPNNNTLTITATDENGLILKDTKANILIKPVTILETFQPFVVLPDTLLYLQTDLDPEKPTVLNIPPELFQKTNTSYIVSVSMTNSENERMERTQPAAYFFSNYELKVRFSNDSICFDLMRNNAPINDIPVSIRLNNETDSHRVTFPYKEKLNPAMLVYHFENDILRQDVVMNNLNPYIELAGGIQKDSFNISLINPQKIEVSWYIYQGGLLLHRGFGNEMEYKSAINDRTQTYYVELLYSFGGHEQIKQRVFEFREDALNIAFDIPEKIYPGQKTDAIILVCDQLGRPVKGADLTAMAVTAKLNYYIPDLDYYGKTSSPRPKTADYSKSDLSNSSSVLKLDYDRWNKIARLDTMNYYRFAYPAASGFKHMMNIADSTQFAPFVMQNGEAKQIYVIEVDHIPVHYSWTNQPSKYSFYISPVKKHVITLRLWDRVIILDSMWFESGRKTILSISLDSLPEGTKVTKLENRFSSTERHRILPTVSSFSRPDARYAYLITDLKKFIPIHGSNIPSVSGNIMVGPMDEGRIRYNESNGLETGYRHRGGFNYAFEENIVYKTDAPGIIPYQLTDASINPMRGINDLVITKEQFFEWQNREKAKRKWQARTIDMIDLNFRMRIFLPEEKTQGIAAVVFQNCITKRTSSPGFDNAYRYRSADYSVPTGCHSIFVIYENGRYLKMDSIPMKTGIHLVIDLNQAKWQNADSLSMDWLGKYAWDPDKYYIYKSEDKPAVYYSSTHTQSGNLTGFIYDENNDPLPGVNIVVKGTQYGTITDVGGNFSLYLDDYSATLQITYIGYISQEIKVTRGSEIRIQLQEEILRLEEVVVVGYGVHSSNNLTGSVAIVDAGEMPAPPDIPEQQPDNSTSIDAEKQLYKELLLLKSIRSDFSDVGFWEPRLFTDKFGLSRFSITFPDDITRWDAVVYAMNRRLQTGTLRKSIRSYKPLMAELNVPQFLTRGDSAFFTGKVLNYTSDSLISGQAQWTGSGTDFTRDIRFTQYHSDFPEVNVISTDSITARYTFTRDDGYFDGEERTVPVVEQGIIRAEGTLSILKNGDVRNAKASENETLIVDIMDNQLEIYEYATGRLINYSYLCNEQLASKLIGFINHKRIMEFKGQPFRYDRDVKRIINRLLRNQNAEFLWSWWDVSNNTSYWMSAHIIRALKCAKDAGYDVNLDIQNITRKAEYKFDFLNKFYLSDIDLLQSLAEWGAELKYANYLSVLDTIVRHYECENQSTRNTCYSFLREKMMLQEIRHMKGLGYQRDSILKYSQEGMLGDIHFSDGKPGRYWYEDEMSANVVAYRIVSRDSSLEHLQVPMQLYFMSTYKDGGWNTYQSSNLLLYVLPDLLAEGTSIRKPATIKLSGKVNEEISEFPFRLELQSGEELTLMKESGMPVYYMEYVNERVTEAKTGVEGFSIKTWLTDDNPELKAGRPVELIVDVSVEKKSAAEYVMIEVPIPGACTYADKRQYENRFETHREYYKEKTVIFCERMDPGKYTFTIRLLPRFTGRYLVNPAQVSLMYIPVVNANTELKKVVVR